jgi:hypothetical protein
VGKPSQTTTGIATHLRLAPIRIEESPLDISLLRPLNEDKPICAHRDPSPADLPGKLSHLILTQKGCSMIDKNEIVSASAHLHKGNPFQRLTSTCGNLIISRFSLDITG